MVSKSFHFCQKIAWQRVAVAKSLGDLKHPRVWSHSGLRQGRGKSWAEGVRKSLMVVLARCGFSVARASFMIQVLGSGIHLHFLYCPLAWCAGKIKIHDKHPCECEDGDSHVGNSVLSKQLTIHP